MKPAALITGASGGIGRNLCSSFKSQGYFVIATDFLPEPEKETKETEEPWYDAYIQADLYELVEEEETLQSFKKEIEALLPRAADGTPLLKVLINNAAVQILNTVANVKLRDWKKTLNVNLLAPFLLIQQFLAPLEAARGSVVNIGSIHSALTKPEFVAYATSKAALSGLTQSLAVDLGHKVRVNVICPAAIETPMLLDGFRGKEEAFKELASAHPVGRIGQPSEVSQLALFLASDAASFITGGSYALDGGISKRLHDPV